jgi:hypothetical protein
MKTLHPSSKNPAPFDETLHPGSVNPAPGITRSVRIRQSGPPGSSPRTTDSDLPAGFDRFWESYPKRVAKADAKHTCATLLLQARTPVHVVSERLGHASVAMTMEVYAHILPDMQQEAAATLGALLHEGPLANR